MILDGVRFRWSLHEAFRFLCLTLAIAATTLTFPGFLISSSFLFSSFLPL